MTQRTDQVASLIRRAVQSTLSRGLHDPRVRGLVSVTKVHVSEDLARATVYVSVIPDEHAELTLHGLQHAAAYIQAQLGRAVRLRRIPRLSFRLDDSIKKQAQLDAALAEARRSDRRPPCDADAATQPEDSNP